MLKSLFRLKPFIQPYRWRLGAGIVAFGIARLFEGFVPILLALGSERSADGNLALLLPVGGRGCKNLLGSEGGSGGKLLLLLLPLMLLLLLLPGVNPEEALWASYPSSSSKVSSSSSS